MLHRVLDRGKVLLKYYRVGKAFFYILWHRYLCCWFLCQNIWNMAILRVEIFSLKKVKKSKNFCCFQK
jgi:hypothetical protein